MVMFSFTLVPLYFLAASRAVLASPCLAFDSSWNLHVFGLGGKDYNAGGADQWSSNNKATDITSSGRPPFDGSNTTCYLSQFLNSIYVMGADSTNPAAVYIYNPNTCAWSIQSVNSGGPDPSALTAILDHDTNVFYGISKNEMWFLDMGDGTSTSSAALTWNDVNALPYGDSYAPVMALAQNHIHFLNVPTAPAGDAMIFVIHFSYFQPEAQAYPLTSGGSGGTFPSEYGQTTSFFQTDGVQQEFAFIPSDSSAVYVLNVETNTTSTLAGPTTKDPKATFFASTSALVQLSSTGAVSYIPYQQGQSLANSEAQWAPVGPIAALGITASSTTASASISTMPISSGMSTKTSTTQATSTGTVISVSNSSTTEQTNGTVGRNYGFVVLASALGMLALVLY